MNEIITNTKEKLFQSTGIGEEKFSNQFIGELRELRRSGFVSKTNELVFEGNKKRIRQLDIGNGEKEGSF
jgi:hypothetical protein